MGPGFVIAATSIGAGSVVSFSNAGSNFGYQLTWWLIVMGIFVFAFNYAMRKFTIVTGLTIQEGINKYFGKGWAMVVAICAMISQTVYGIGNFIAVGLGFMLLFPGLPLWVGGAIGFVACVIMYILKNIYKKAEIVTKICVFVMAVLFIVSLCATFGISDDVVVSTSVIGIPQGSFAVMLALFGTTASLATQAWATSLCKDKGYVIEDIKAVRVDTIIQVVATIGLSACFMFVGAKLLPGQPIQNAGGLANALVGVFGAWIRPVFGIGFLAAAWSSQIMAPKLGTDFLFEALGKKDKEMTMNIVNIIMLAVGGVIAIAVGGIPTQLLTLAQIGGVINTPILGILTIILLCRKDIMKEHKIKLPYIIGICIVFAVCMVVIVNNVINIIGSIGA